MGEEADPASAEWRGARVKKQFTAEVLCKGSAVFALLLLKWHGFCNLQRLNQQENLTHPLMIVGGVTPRSGAFSVPHQALSGLCAGDVIRSGQPIKAVHSSIVEPIEQRMVIGDRAPYHHHAELKFPTHPLEVLKQEERDWWFVSSVESG